MKPSSNDNHLRLVAALDRELGMGAGSAAPALTRRQQAVHKMVDDWSLVDHSVRGLALLFANVFGDELIFDPERGFYAWSGQAWSHYAGRARDFEPLNSRLDDLLAVADVATHADVHRLRNDRFSMLREETVSALAKVGAGASFDADPYLLGVDGGVIEFDPDSGSHVFRSGDIRDRITRRSAFCYPNGADADCPTVDKVLAEWMDGDVARVEWLWLALGSTLVGKPEDLLHAFVGEGGDGKSVLLRYHGELMGDYAIAIDDRALSDVGTGRRDIALLHGRRFAYIPDFSVETNVNDGVFKRLSGGDRLRGAFMRRMSFDFEPSHKLFASGNDTFAMSGADRATHRRLRYVRFSPGVRSVVLDDDDIARKRADPQLGEKMRLESQGYFLGLLRGAQQWIQNGGSCGRPPQRIIDDVRGDLADRQPLHVWFEEACELQAGHEVPAADLFRSYRRWHDDRGTQCPTKSDRAFGTQMRRLASVRPIEPRRSKRGAIWTGLRLIG